MSFKSIALGLTLALALSACAAVPPACRVGFDIGSSGIRVGASDSELKGRVSIDYLTDVWADNLINDTVEATVTALRDLAPNQGCVAVAGGYSAWRLATEKGGADKVADTLRDLRERTGVSVYVIPQAVEGGYGYFAAKRHLGERLATPYILDIGGGSLQFATAESGWGTALGQKAWRRAFCAEIKGDTNTNCAANPVGADAMAQSRRVLMPQVTDAKAALGSGIAVTAISTPVVKTIHPILTYLTERKTITAGQVDAGGFDRVALESAIAFLGTRDNAGVLAALNGCNEGAAKPLCRARFVSNFVTDMLLLQSFMEGLGITRMLVAEAEVTNVPGILADERALAWADKYPCYLARLRTQGVDAYLSDPGSCH